MLSLPYSERQLIVVAEDSIVEAAQQKERKTVEFTKSGFDWIKFAKIVVMDVLPIPFAPTITEVPKEAFKAWGRARESGINVFPAGTS